jgi:hypothetical protein
MTEKSLLLIAMWSQAGAYSYRRGEGMSGAQTHEDKIASVTLPTIDNWCK